jgi:ankyrin repeat protein
MYATSNGQYEVTKLLLVNGADKKIATAKGNTALDFARKNNYTGIVELF